MTEYVKKRIPVEAWQVGSDIEAEWIGNAIQSGTLWSSGGADADPKVLNLDSDTWLETGLGAQPVEIGDWIVRKLDGLMYVMDDLDFTNAFEER